MSIDDERVDGIRETGPGNESDRSGVWRCHRLAVHAFRFRSSGTVKCNGIDIFTKMLELLQQCQNAIHLAIQMDLVPTQAFKRQWVEGFTKRLILD